ncbi:MAG: DUF5363 domain-containing protein [Pseudomonadota bacterium]|nr:DUF5363 domain-containing protein [Gallaecimonas pentaromativorans]MED5526115.1 DUF5363 domain-containing protein [Pseudomonadota bacterium]
MNWFKNWLARYDAWSLRWGLHPVYKRSCVPQKKERD